MIRCTIFTIFTFPFGPSSRSITSDAPAKTAGVKSGESGGSAALSARSRRVAAPRAAGWSGGREEPPVWRATSPGSSVASLSGEGRRFSEVRAPPAVTGAPPKPPAALNYRLSSGSWEGSAATSSGRGRCRPHRQLTSNCRNSACCRPR